MEHDYIVSICVPVYGVERYIEKCARSIFGQTYQNIEIIFINDQTQDASIDIIKRLLVEYPYIAKRVRIINHSRNRGLAAARNTGIEHARGEFIIHVDSDDWIERDAVESLVRKQLETGADIVSGNATAYYNDHVSDLIEPNYGSKDKMLQNIIGLTLDHVIWRRLIRRDLYIKYNISAVEGVNIGEDHQVLPQLVYYAKSVAILDKKIYNYNCMNINSYMHSDSFEKAQRTIENDLESINILMDFFKGKSSDCFETMYEVKVQRLLGGLSTYVKYRKKDYYKECWNRISELKRYWQKTILQNPLKRVVLRYYYLNLVRYVIVYGF